MISVRALGYAFQKGDILRGKGALKEVQKLGKQILKLIELVQ